MKTKYIYSFVAGMIGAIAIQGMRKIPVTIEIKKEPQIDVKKLKEITYKLPEILNQIDALYAINLNHKRGPWAALHFLDRAKKMTFDVFEELIEMANPQLARIATRLKVYEG